MGQMIQKCGIKRETGWLYYLGKDGNVWRAQMARGRTKGSRGKPQLVMKTGVKRETGYLYYIDKKGDVARAKMARGGRRKKKR